ncbi:DUF411 domain-containing protein [Caenispirillum bisanense]|uniref:Uncharacterized conserved protein n=1 Tax=Caenispirillum bisanense TaxID=414052 RepID=A0A286GAZ6_9PROT|nr:DUF411 domain-containing protein [Caenispirillum bisanense]SOD92680.1 Uncharacterized conserved protein [Caenispirillum bisanense]
MRKIVLLPLAAAAGWLSVTAAVFTQDPVVEVTAAAGCAAEAEAWAASLAADGFEVVRGDPATATASADSRTTACVAGRTGGFALEGAVPPDMVSVLLRKKPRGVTGLTVDGAPEGGVLALNRDGSRSAFPPPKKDRS